MNKKQQTTKESNQPRRAAIDLARSHPHLNMPGGCEIEIHEAQATPGK